MTALAVTAITNFILACETFLFTGMLVKTKKAPQSAAWFWTWALGLLGLGALLGGIDHGFVELLGGAARYALQRINWLVLGGTTFCTLMTTSRQFFPRNVQRVVTVLGVLQLLAFAILVFTVGDFLVVILNYAPVMLLLLVCSLLGLRSGTGGWPMIIGIVILVLASAIQALGVDTFSPLDRSGLYHVISMAGVVFLYLGGLQLKVDGEP